MAIATYKKLESLSNFFYNDGLEKAGVRDLTGAIESLQQSLRMDKNNIDARNLLGLVYYETGEVVAALSEWVISKNLRPEDNIADDYMDMVRNSPSKLEDINQTIKKFNIAFNYCRQGSLDLAVIQLKKVLSLNPSFIKAHLLLALLYLKAGNFDRAKTEAQKVLKLDTGNLMAKRYLKEADNMLLPGDGGKLVSDVASSGNDEIIRYNSGNEMIIQPRKQSVLTKSGSIWGIVLGVYDFIWDEFCDWYIEMVKPRLYNSDDKESHKAALWTLQTVLINALKLLHPYMPFITEEIFCTLQDEEESIMISDWPVYKDEWNFASDEKAIETIKEAVRGIRNVRTQMNVAPSRKAKVFVVSDNDEVLDIFSTGKLFFESLAYDIWLI